MIPSPQLRITSIIHSLRNVVIPSVDADNPLALEQCELIIAQLSMLSEQIPFVARYHEACLDDAVCVAKKLLPEDGGIRTVESAGLLRAALSDAPALTDHYEAYHLLGAAIERHIRAVHLDGNEDYRNRLERDILAFAKRQAGRERSWFKDSGLDHNPAELKTIGDLLNEMENDAR